MAHWNLKGLKIITLSKATDVSDFVSVAVVFRSYHDVLLFELFTLSDRSH